MHVPPLGNGLREGANAVWRSVSQETGLRTSLLRGSGVGLRAGYRFGRHGERSTARQFALVVQLAGRVAFAAALACAEVTVGKVKTGRWLQ